MKDEELIALAPTLPILYFDGFGAFRKVNGLLRCVGYTLDLGPQANLLMSIPGCQQGCVDAMKAINDKTSSAHRMWNGVSLTH